MRGLRAKTRHRAAMVIALAERCSLDEARRRLIERRAAARDAAATRLAGELAAAAAAAEIELPWWHR